MDRSGLRYRQALAFRPHLRSSRQALRGVFMGGVLITVVGAVDRAAAQSCERPAEIAAMTEAPPMPDFFDPVDYAGMLIAGYRDRGKPEWADTYKGLWEPASRDKEMPSPSRVGRGVSEKLCRRITGPVWRSADEPELAKYLDLVRPHLEVFLSETEKPGVQLRLSAGKDRPHDPMSILLPEKISAGNYAVLALLAECWRDKAAEPEQMLQAWRCGLRYASHLEHTHQSLLLNTATTNRLAVYASIRDAVFRERLNQEQLTAAISLLEEYQAKRWDWNFLVRCFWMESLGFVQSLYPRGCLDEEYAKMFMLIGKGGKQEGLNIPAARETVTPCSIVETVDEYFSDLIPILQKPLSAKGLIEAVRVQRQASQQLIPVRKLAAMLLVDPARILTKELHAIIEHRGTSLVLRIVRHRLQHGAYPASLAEGCDDRSQCIDPTLGREFGYAVVMPGECADRGASFRLRSGILSEGSGETAGRYDCDSSRWGLTTVIVFWPPATDD